MTSFDRKADVPESAGAGHHGQDLERQSLDRSPRVQVGGWRVWACLGLSAALAAATLLWFGLSLWTVLVIGALLTCPAVMAWGYFVGQRPLPFPVGSVPQTHGMTTNWAAPYYDGFCHAIGLGTAFRARTLSAAGLKPGEHVLDVGCGTGVLTRLAAAAVDPRGSALGLDPAPDMIRIARQNGVIEGSHARFLPGAIERLPVESGSADVVILSLVLNHLPPELKRSGLGEVFRVVSPGGRLVVVDLDRATGRFGRVLGPILRAIPHLREHIDGRIPALIDAAGFRQITAVGSWAGTLTFWTARKQRSAAAK